MKNWQFILAFAAVFGLIILILKVFPPPGAKEAGFKFVRMTLTSEAFKNNATLPARYTCDDAGLNPPLVFSDVPTAAKTISLTIEDPDAPKGTFIHLPPTDFVPETTGVAEGQLRDYIPPCPPSGIHHYKFILTALNDKGNVISKSELVGLYGK